VVLSVLLDIDFWLHIHKSIPNNIISFQHGEPGAAVADLQPVEVVVSHVLQQILSPVC
jgi:hypothetical protein